MNYSVQSVTDFGPKLAKPYYTIREAAGIAGISQRVFRKRLTELYHGRTWFVSFGQRRLVPAGVLTRYFDRGGIACPHCRRPYTSPGELRNKDLWFK